jgi:hypothetical protein
MAYNLKEMTEMCSKWVAENGLMEHVSTCYPALAIL